MAERKKISKRAFDKRVRRRLAKGESGNQIIREIRASGVQVNESRVRELRRNQPTYASGRDLTRRYLYHGIATIDFGDAGGVQDVPINFGSDVFIPPRRQRDELRRIADLIADSYEANYGEEISIEDVEITGVEVA